MPADSQLPASKKSIPIVYMIDYLVQGGGMENQLIWLLRGLDRDMFNPRLVCLRQREPGDVRDVGCPIDYLGVTKLASFKAAKALGGLVSLLREHQAQILQIFSLDSNILGVLAGRLAGVPNIVVCRRDMGLWYGNGPLRLVNRINRMAANCLVNSEAVKRSVVEHETFEADQVSVVYNGIPAPPPPGNPPITRTELGIPEDVPLIGIVANLREVKRHDRLVRVLDQMSTTNAHLLIVGTGPQEQPIRQQVDELGLTDRVHFYYTVTRTLEVMKLFDVGALVSESEGLSNVLVEYALTGVPAVVFDTGGNREVVIDGETGYLIDCFDETKMAEKIDLLLNDDTLLQRQSENALSMAPEKFSLDKMVESTQDYYLRVVSESRHGDR